MALDLVQKGFAGGKWAQQIHRDCGDAGEIVIIVQRETKKLAACCKACKRRWEFPQVEGWPIEWTMPDLATAGKRIILPSGWR